MSAYLDAWVAGVLLGGVAVAQWLLDRRLVGVSGFVTRASQWLANPTLARDEDRAMRADPEALRRALLEATDGEMGGDADASAVPLRKPRRFVTSRAAALYLVALAVGGAIAALQRGSWSLSTSLGAAYEARWGDGPLALMPLLSAVCWSARAREWPAVARAAMGWPAAHASNPQACSRP
jgi:hypothetical protein